jgi:hypothetical protein
MGRRVRQGLILVGLVFGLAAIVYYVVLAKGVPKGNWHGAFTTPSGRQGALQLVIKGPKVPKVGAPGSDVLRRFDGTARLCIESRRSQEYEIVGRIRGADSFMTLSTTGETVVGLRFTDLDIVWKGDSLTVSGYMQDFDGTNSVSQSGNPDHSEVTTVALQKGSDADYSAACDRLPTSGG